MSRTAWDCISRRDFRVGARRWTVEWWTWRDGHGGSIPECEHHLLENCTEAHTRSFPNRGLAVAFAKRRQEPRFAAWPRVALEEFEDDGCTGYGWWERVGEYEEIESLAPPQGGTEQSK